MRTVAPQNARICRFPPRIVLRIFLPRFDFRTAFLAVAALLFAQLGAMTHAYSHDTASSTTPRTALAHDLCKDCLAYAPLLSASTPSALPAVEPQGGSSGAVASHTSLLDLAPPLAFRSRAPPTRF
jgi:hypothetical protein